MRKRPETGLLGGMTEIPTSAWRDAAVAAGEGSPLRAAYRPLPGAVTHVFTHFELSLTVHIAETSAAADIADGYWVDEADLENEALPSVMRKVVAHAIAGGG